MKCQLTLLPDLTMELDDFNKMQTPGSSVSPLRAAAVADALYENPAHVRKRKVAQFASARQSHDVRGRGQQFSLLSNAPDNE